MSVSFFVVGAQPHCSPRDFECRECWDQEPNLANTNARALLAALNLDDEDLTGEARARDLVPALKRLAKTPDPGEPMVVTGNFTDCGRDAGYLQKRANELLELCQKAGELGVIAWG